jgi:hypothetical protein
MNTLNNIGFNNKKEFFLQNYKLHSIYIKNIL